MENFDLRLHNFRCYWMFLMLLDVGGGVGVSKCSGHSIFFFFIKIGFGS